MKSPTDLRQSFERAQQLPPVARRKALNSLRQDCVQRVEASGEGMEGTKPVAQLLSRIDQALRSTPQEV